MIPDNIAVNISKATPSQKKEIKKLFLKNYENMLDSALKNNDNYITTIGCFTNPPFSKEIVTSNSFVKRFSKRIMAGKFKTYAVKFLGCVTGNPMRK